MNLRRVIASSLRNAPSSLPCLVGLCAALGLSACAGTGDSTSSSSGSHHGSGSGSSSGSGSGSSGTGVNGNVEALYVVPSDLSQLSDEHFLDQPRSNDLRLENGSPLMKGYFNPRGSLLLGAYIKGIAGKLDGFSPTAAGFVRFTGPIDTSTLPGDPKSGASSNASVQLVDIDPKSPELGARKLVMLEWHERDGVYWQANTLAFLPVPGFPLRVGTRYAFVVTQDVHAADGSTIGRGQELEQVLGLASASGPTADARAALAPAVANLASQGVEASRIAQVAIFTTGDPTAELFALRDALPKVIDAPKVHNGDWSYGEDGSTFDEYEGWYGPSPNFQQGSIPYLTSGGNFEWDNGLPVVADTFDLRFSLMVPQEPACPMPPNGYPIVLYALRTGGDYRSYVGDGTGYALAKRCVATMGIDQIFHGARPGARLLTPRTVSRSAIVARSRRPRRSPSSISRTWTRRAPTRVKRRPTKFSARASSSSPASRF